MECRFRQQDVFVMKSSVMVGRPQVEINWEQVDKLLKGGANGLQIAAHFGIHHDTLYRRCQEDNKISFTEYAQSKKAAGDALIHLAQFNKALKGDSGMLKWLGVHRLGQKETNLNEIAEASKKGTIDAVREIQEENRARIGTIGRSVVEDEQSLLDQGCTGKENKISDELGAEGIV
jgi:AraC-like DNA-binding protein